MNGSGNWALLGIYFLCSIYYAWPLPGLGAASNAASLTLDYRYASAVPFEEKDIYFNLIYKATESGVKGEHTRVEKNVQCEGFSFASSCRTTKYTVWAEKTIQLKIGTDIERIAPNQLLVRFAEFLPGSGAYKLNNIIFGLEMLPSNTRELRFDGAAANQHSLRSVVLLGSDLHSSVHLRYQGTFFLPLEEHRYALYTRASKNLDYMDQGNWGNPHNIAAYQDQRGDWHINKQAFVDWTSCISDNERTLNRTEQSTLTAFKSWKEVTLYSSNLDNQHCIKIVAKKKRRNNQYQEDDDEREYYYIDGNIARITSRATMRFINTASLRYEEWRFINKQPYAYSKTYYIVNKKFDVFWNQAAQIAWPKQIIRVSPALKLNFDARLKEAKNVWLLAQ